MQLTDLDHRLLRLDEEIIVSALAAYKTGDPLAARIALRDILVRIGCLDPNTSALLEYFTSILDDDS